VLNLLSEEPMHPYQIERIIRERHKEWAMGRTRSLYHAVDRLVADVRPRSPGPPCRAAAA
jgi:DNA-binding PadR family transcriptional regulator